jgi:hypothetical protein
MSNDFSKAKSYYKKAIRRSECPLGAYNMMVSLYIREARDTVANGKEQA